MKNQPTGVDTQAVKVDRGLRADGPSMGLLPCHSQVFLYSAVLGGAGAKEYSLSPGP